MVVVCCCCGCVLCGFSYLTGRKVEIGPAKMANFSRVVSHLFTGGLADIGKLPALVGWYRLVWATLKTIASSDI